MVTTIMPESFISEHHHTVKHQDEERQVYQTATP